jgi:hypothetical protein
MAEEVSIREKSTEPMILQALADGSPIDLNGIDHVELRMMDAKGKTYLYSEEDSSPAIAVTEPSAGQVTFTPPDEYVFKYTRTPYKLYLKIYDTATESYTVPESGEENIINVRKEF